MKKLSNKITAIVGTATLAVGLMALPALAGTTQQQGTHGWGKCKASCSKSFHQVNIKP
ncbi:hypothetical protein [Desulfosporosinus sp. BG]|uniref:hypothetical protein n=1 Tax=Desulfosporosinus sp. BG TaxID=1633135 RepID=UPI00085802BA|nr:hypothetical protein DSBG_3751 [Desulfosporosinus sp. BG]